MKGSAVQEFILGLNSQRPAYRTSTAEHLTRCIAYMSEILAKPQADTNLSSILNSQRQQELIPGNY